MSKWQPIETAPRDGTAFLAYYPDWSHTFIARQEIQRTWWTEWGGGCWDSELQKGSSNPTHWMPLPEPPEREE